VLIPYAEESAINELNGALGRLAYLTARVIAHDRSPPVAVVKKDFPGLTLGGFREMYLQSVRDTALKRFTLWKAKNGLPTTPSDVEKKSSRYKRRNEEVEKVYEEEERERKKTRAT
jgi:hypothetical protein